MTLSDRCAALPIVARRLLALVVVPLLLLTLCVGSFVPARQVWQAQQDWRRETRDLLSAAAAAPELQMSLERQIESVRHTHLRSKFYPTDGVLGAAAVLQGDVDLLMSSLQVPSRTIAPITAVETESLVRHGVRLSASLRINQLQDLLNRISQHPRLMRVDSLTVVAPQTQSPEDNPPLAVSMEIFGYALTPDRDDDHNVMTAAGEHL